MASEIERKFLVRDASWQDAIERSEAIQQGYLAQTDRATIRVRVMGERGLITVKGVTNGITRDEYEYPIPVEEARAMLETLSVSSVIEKIRYQVRVGTHRWEIDVFAGENSGLILAEIELEREDAPFERPSWLGEEVSYDPRYFNANLARRPFRLWPVASRSS
ncbi:adenylate cyclase [Thiocapsa imhoffii]|uniref:Adenylate cyclase n=1 Tax=Thiocapsa imhoffii TaxID=382777 RepID=A0A9X1B9L1_9GAMM|nr:CYTH domain-containing protein [Thiocapsa imhoffii]MBK1645977.1 adenylate cyclase [Thiocapsa imhoffii]